MSAVRSYSFREEDRSGVDAVLLWRFVALYRDEAALSQRKSGLLSGRARIQLVHRFEFDVVDHPVGIAFVTAFLHRDEQMRPMIDDR